MKAAQLRVEVLEAEIAALRRRCELLQQCAEGRVAPRAVQAVVLVQAMVWLGLGVIEKRLLGVC